MLFAAGEIIQREGEFGGGDGAEVALDAVLEDHARFGRAVREDVFNQWMGREKLHDGLGFFCGNEEVEVADDFLFSAETPGDLRLADLGVGAEVFEERPSEGGDVAKAELSGVAAHVLDGFENIRGGLLSESGKRGDPAVLAGTLEAGDRMDF